MSTPIAADAPTDDILSPRTIGQMLEDRAMRDPDVVYCRFGDQALTLRQLRDRVRRLTIGLIALGLERGDRVAVMLPNHPDYVVAFLAMARIGVCQVPINVNLRGHSLEYVIQHSALSAIIADAKCGEQLRQALRPGDVNLIVARAGVIESTLARVVSFESLAAADTTALPPLLATPDDTLLISYTSGTTGAPKGVLVTDRMLQACGWAAARLAELRPGDVLYLWEPIYHIGGAEVLIVGLLEPVTLAIAERFSVSRFWQDARRYRATHIHFFGGVLALLLKEPPNADDRRHGVRVAWGGGCPITIWEKFRDRFGVEIRECYGMTEASSFTTLNMEGRLGSIGKPLPYFDVRIADDNGAFVGPEVKGEIWVREKIPGVIMKGYFRNPEASQVALVDGWLRTGDLGYCDKDGFFYYSGRKKDSFRLRGENVSAWEVERVLNEHPAVAESAVVGVENELSDQDMKAFLRLKPGATLAPSDLLTWCDSRLAKFQIPRFIAFIDTFPKTPTERIRKELLSRSIDDCFDARVPDRNRAQHR
ncbi:MAG TPA: AMP-binding protein [Alphaproteobacteria bacterium]|nr:AMP-binding protein [Alphaproteobacteria bacterium]